MTAVEDPTTPGIGDRMLRKEDAKLVTGEAKFVDDIKAPGQLWMGMVRSTMAHATITGIDTSEAEGMPGVHAVYTGQQLADLGLWAVADGMGGHAAGNVASNMAVQTFNKHITGNFPSENLSQTLNEAVLQANNSISETVRETAALKGMGCTLVAIVLEETRLRWVSVGDSHLYICRDGQLKKLNA